RWLSLSLILIRRPVPGKISGSEVLPKSLIFMDFALRTWRFARPQGVEKERGNRGENARNRPLRVGAKSASRSEKPRQAWDLAGLIGMQRGRLCNGDWWWTMGASAESLLQELQGFAYQCPLIAKMVG
ncbi:hypothetical protein, partial [Ralstonia pseudosolanacearum]|uniref:hypothetical protein n=1 Tax=Ralstonia pseudosolanacearum TaxID=1310165 RepID=UPI001FF71D0C